MTWLILLLAAASVAYGAWVYKMTCHLAYKTKRITQSIVLGSVKMGIRSEEITDMMILTAERLKMIGEDFTE